MRRLKVLFGVVLVALGMVVTAGVASADDPTYHTFAYDVAARAGGETNWYDCMSFPSTTNCNWVQERVNPNWPLVVHCQKAGQNINGNPNWLFVDVHVPAGAFANYAWVASYYIDYPGNVLPVRWCNPGEGAI